MFTFNYLSYLMELYMKVSCSIFNILGMLRIALLIIMLSTILFLFGDEYIVNQCPMDFGYEVTSLDGTDTPGSRYLITYTISIDPEKATKYDLQRTYRLSSEFFVNDMGYGSFRTVSSDVQNEETFTYSQFPLTRQLTIMYYGKTYGCIDSPFIDMYLEGYAVDGCPDASIPDGDVFIQQSSSFNMLIPSGDNDEDNEFIEY